MTLEERVSHLEQLMREIHNPHWWLKIGSWQGKDQIFHYKECSCGERRPISETEYQALSRTATRTEVE